MINRNYKLLQFFLDCFALFQLYLLVLSIAEFIAQTTTFNETFIKAEGGENVAANPYPLVIWAVIGVSVCVASVILPFVYKNRVKYTQKQFDMWVYGVLLTRTVALLALTEIAGKHAKYIIRAPESWFSFQALADIFLIAVIIRFTQFRIKKAEPKQEKKSRIIIEED